MTRTEIISLVEGHLTDALAGMEKEYPKMDFKSKWYDLKNETEINEFIKDTSAIANTPGLDGFIVIGYDDTAKNFQEAVFTNSQLKDTSVLDGIIVRRVDRNYAVAVYDENILGHNLSILHIPPSFDKPHVVKNYTSKAGQQQPHRVFIRRGTTTQLATKYDLDFIAYDRKNLLPEYSLFISTSTTSMSVGHSSSQKIDLDMGIVIENNGRRPVAIVEIIMNLVYAGQMFSFISSANIEEKYNNLIAVSNIIIPPGTIKNLPALKFISSDAITSSEFLKFRDDFYSVLSVEAQLKLNTGHFITTTVQMI